MFLSAMQGEPSRRIPQVEGLVRARVVCRVLPSVAFVLLLAIPTAAQSPGAPHPPTHTLPIGSGRAEEEGNINFDPRIEAKRIATLNAIRQKAMVTDAEKLLRLAKELSDDATAGGTILPPAVRVRKAAEIEKLAKNVKEKMTYVMGDTPDYTVPFSGWQR